MDRIYPSWQDVKNFRNPLTPGELHLAMFLDTDLPEDWKIYVQPYLNGDRPDIVILNPSVGIMIFEVKDWSPDCYHCESSIEGEFHYYVTDGRGSYRIPSPVSQVNRYRDNLIELYLPILGEEIDKDPRQLAAFRTGLYFHNMTSAQAKELVDIPSHKCSVFGHDDIENENLDQIVPDWNRKHTLTLFPVWAEEIQTWLKPPFQSLEQGKKIRLTPDQERHAQPSPHQHQRLRGVAGSGKTLVIAQRAARSAEQGKKVLVVTYNITLWHYIRDHVSRAKHRFGWNKIEFSHFHGFCRNYLSENNILWPHDDDAGDLILGVTVPELVKESITSGMNKKYRLYDVILIDEGQDFEQLWYMMLCEFLSENDELLLVVDEMQNLYERNLTWIESMRGTKFRGRWRQLKESYRLPDPVIDRVNEFVIRYMSDKNNNLLARTYQPGLPGFDPRLLWRNISSLEEVIAQSWSIFDDLTRKFDTHPQDIVILVPTHNVGWKLVEFFETKKVRINHVFEDEEKSHRHKKSFWMGDPRLKMCTIHSFKGWELLNVVLITPTDEQIQNGSMDHLIYTAITRSRQTLIVINRNARYYEYGRAWPKTWEQE